MDEGLGMDILDTGDELVGEEENGLQGEFAVAEIEQILQAGSEEVEDHSIIVALGSEPADEGDANTASKRLVHAGFILKLGVLGLDALELDSDLFAGDDVGAYCSCQYILRVL